MQNRAIPQSTIAKITFNHVHLRERPEKIKKLLLYTFNEVLKIVTNVQEKCLTFLNVYVIIIVQRNEIGDTTMRNTEIRQTVTELQELYAQADLLKAKITAREALIKEEMDARETEELNLGNVIIRFTSILSNRFDTTAFKRLHKDLYNEFIKQVASRRFSIA